MNTKKITTKSIILCITGCIMLLMAGFGALKLQNTKFNTYAVGSNSIAVDLSNPNFNSNTSSSYPFKPNSYNAYNGNVKDDNSSSDTKANVNAGVINLDNEKYSTKFSLAKRTSLDNYVLMVDSSKEEDGKTTFHTVNYGYRTGSNIKMNADARYMVTVDVFTATDAKIAELFLFDNKGNEFSSIKGINSYNTWTTYSFFVATNNTESLELSLGMYLNGAGTVLFDNLSCFQLSESDYEFNKTNANVGSYKEENKIDNIVAEYSVNNDGEFVNNSNALNKSSLTAVNYEFNKNTFIGKVNDSDGNYSQAILIENIDSTFAQYETVKDFLTFEQNTIYKVSLNVKTKNLEGNANLQLVRTDVEDSDSNAIIDITSNTTSNNESVSNDYTTYSFYINSHPSQEVSYKLVLGLGKDKDNLATGKMLVSGIEISKVNYDNYSSADSNSKIDLVSKLSYSDSKIRLKNGQFNAFEISNYNEPMPATPTSWDVTLGNNTQKYGVVNTSSSSFAKLTGYSNLRNPYSTDVNENVLMMYNESADTLSYKSSSKKLDAKSYHKFEINVQTQNSPLKLSLVTTKDDKEIELSTITVNTNNSWQTVSMYLYTGYQSFEVSLKLTLNSTSYAYAYVDDAKFDYLLTSAQLEEEFKSASNSNYSVVTDLSKLLTTTSTENFAPATLFSTENTIGVEKAGIITLNSAHLDEVIYDSANLESFNSLATDKVLGIRTMDDVYYTMTSKVGYKLSSGDKFYKLSVSVYTQNIDTNNNEVDKTKLGATLKLSGFEGSFTNVISNNEWTTYTFYIKAESELTTYLELSLGNADVKAKGDVFFGNIELVEDVTADEFNAVKDTATVKVLKTQTKTEDKEEDKEPAENNNQNNSNNAWLYLIPSLLTAAAILIAVVGIAVRKIKWKKPTKKSKTAYDRNKTVSVQYYSRKATTMREQKLRELQADLEKLHTERKIFEDSYKADLTKLREMKLKRANPADIAKLEKDLKKNQKLSSTIGVNVNKITYEIEMVKTDAYLNNLIKKLQREPVKETDLDNENK